MEYGGIRPYSTEYGRAVTFHGPLHILRASTVESASVVERITKTEAELAVYQKGDGVFTKPNVISNAKTLAPAMWRGTYCKHLPLLSCLVGGASCASAASLRLGGRAQLVRVRPDQNDGAGHGAGAHGPRATPWATSLYFATRPST